MDPANDLPDLIEDLEAHIDDLETSLAPLLTKPLSTTSSTLPLLDKAKLSILSAYAIESLLFSSLLASGVDAKSHPIFSELVRLKGYFGKIKDAESGPAEPKARIDKEAAARFIRHGLSGNERFDRERRERERDAAKRNSHIKFDQEAESVKMQGLAKKRAAEITEDSKVENEDGEEEEEEIDVDAENAELYGSSTPVPAPHSRKKPRTSPAADLNPTTTEDTNSAPFMTLKEKRRSDRRARKEAEKAARLAGTANGKEEEIILPSRAPRTHSETFNALLQGGLPKKSKGKGK